MFGTFFCIRARVYIRHVDTVYHFSMLKYESTLLHFLESVGKDWKSVEMRGWVGTRTYMGMDMKKERFFRSNSSIVIP